MGIRFRIVENCGTFQKMGLKLVVSLNKRPEIKVYAKKYDILKSIFVNKKALKIFQKYFHKLSGPKRTVYKKN